MGGSAAVVVIDTGGSAVVVTVLGRGSVGAGVALVVVVRLGAPVVVVRLGALVDGCETMARDGVAATIDAPANTESVAKTATSTRPRPSATRPPTESRCRAIDIVSSPID
jgi:hypothetical protein